MSGWGGGYVTDIPYTVGYYEYQSPVMAALAAIMGGYVAPIPAGDDPVLMLELGCGFGYTALALAASNPNWTIVGVDFNPAHIAGARAWAAEAGLKNVTFIEGDFTRWEEDPTLRNLPQQDFVTMHGIWSWISPAAQRGIVRLLGEKVRPGGLVHVSYNALPGWSEMMGPARLIREIGQRTAGTSDKKARAGIDVLRELAKTEAYYLHNRPNLASRLETMEKAEATYLAHEFMNEQWAPCFVTDVAAMMGEAKLEYAGASRLQENFPELVLNQEQRVLWDSQTDPVLRELIVDHCISRGLRHDVYVRGARRSTGRERNETLMNLSLNLVKRVDALPDELAVPAGKAELNKAFYLPIVQALSTRPWRVRDLLGLPGLVGQRDNPAELVGILIGAELAVPALRPMSPPGEAASRFNAVTAMRMARTEVLNRGVAAACQPTGTPIMTPLLALIVCKYMRDGITDVEGLIRALDAPPGQEEEARSSVMSCLERFIPILKVAGAC